MLMWPLLLVTVVVVGASADIDLGPASQEQGQGQGAPREEGIPEACPHGCRCSAGPGLRGRHRWHRLLAAYRARRLLYGRLGAGRDFHPRPPGHTARPTGREMTCLGLKAMPDSLPSDISKLSVYGDTKGSTYQQDSPYGSQYYGQADDRKSNIPRYYRQITSIGKYAFNRVKNIKELEIEGNRVKVVHPDDFEMLGTLRRLRMRNNRLKVLWARSFRGLDLLEELDISRNHIKRLSKTLFYDTPMLRTLNLHKNRIRGLHTKLFKPLKYLQTLDVSENFLKDLHKDLFLGTESLHELNADHNNIKYIRPEWFVSLGKLNKLSLKGNRIVEVSQRTLAPVPSLKHLDLEMNHISHIPAGAFMHVENLQHLDLSTNNISKIDSGGFEGLSFLRELDLSMNYIEDITNGTFQGLEHLTMLSLASNNLLQVENVALITMPHLTRLDLSDNQIKIIKTKNFYGMLELRELKLNHNEVKVIEEQGFAVSVVNNYSKLTWLYLQYNLIGTIASRTMYGLSYLKFLNLGHNEVDLIEEGGFSMMGRLHTLILNDNRLGHINIGTFKHLRHLRHLNMASNRLRELPFNVFLGLEQVEDTNLQDNKIKEITTETFLDTPHLISLNLKSNRLKRIDLSLLDVAHNLKYLNLASNGISKVKTPSFLQGNLFFLSLVDNNLRHLSADVVQAMVASGSLHLYGNPWTCDCRFSWVLNTEENTRVKLPESEEIVCKAPKPLSGEQVLALHEEELECLAADQQEPEAETESLGCTFTEHAQGDTTRADIKERKSEVTSWVVTFLDLDLNVTCRGVAVAPDWVLTSSNCWKDYTGSQLRLVVGDNTDTIQLHQVDVTQVEHFPGPLNLALVKIQSDEDLEGQRVSPCILSNQGFKESSSHAKLHGILETQYRGSSKGKIKLRSLPFKLNERVHCPDELLCIIGRPGKDLGATYESDNAPFFVKVGRSRWALAGLLDKSLVQNLGFVIPLFPAIQWMEDVIL